jgi:hypothetical protein
LEYGAAKNNSGKSNSKQFLKVNDFLMGRGFSYFKRIENYPINSYV